MTQTGPIDDKFVLVDDSAVVIGSHNWAAGSYSAFDDVSLLLTGTALATQQAARFNALRAVGTIP